MDNHHGGLPPSAVSTHSAPDERPGRVAGALIPGHPNLRALLAGGCRGTIPRRMRLRPWLGLSRHRHGRSDCTMSSTVHAKEKRCG